MKNNKDKPKSPTKVRTSEQSQLEDKEIEKKFKKIKNSKLVIDHIKKQG